MAILAGYGDERFRRCPTEESITENTGVPPYPRVICR
jgi:hypothetical protein